MRVNTSLYQFSHGKLPRGGCAHTAWAFEIEGEVKFFNGKYADAKRQAVAFAKSVDAFEIFVLP